ncbi:MAG: metallophosphoesterase [Candidatus Lokiarchaeota archaeon]|nr:metallophosphoesterase [Candidatus Lokiarchaeota archaeon]
MDRHTMDRESLENFINLVIPYLKNKPVLRDIKKSPVLYVGDIHGNYQDLQNAFAIANKKKVSTIVFLGDYVDRGSEQLRTLIKVMDAFARSEGYSKYGIVNDFIDEQKYPYLVIALKGNHEDIEINQKYGLKEELVNIHGFRTFPKLLLQLLYAHLPLVARTRWKTLAVHGGIPLPDRHEKVSEIMKHLDTKRTPLFIDYTEESEIELGKGIYQLLWNDPVNGIDKNLLKFTPSFRGYGIYNFNKAALIDFLQNNGYKRLVRAHETVKEGGKVLWDNVLIHIFSTSPYFGRIQNKGYFLEYDDGSGEILNGKGDKMITVDEII